MLTGGMRTRIEPAQFAGRTKEEQLADLREQVADCQKCPGIVEARAHTVFGEGNPNAALMFVGEAPGRHEDDMGKPFVGPAGIFLTRLILALGINRNGVYIANALKCRPHTRPGETNRKPTRPELLDCAPFLYAQILIVEPVVIVALGDTALEALGVDERITVARGKWHQFGDIPVMPTFHPAYVLRNATPDVRSQIWHDILDAWESCGLKASEARAWVPPL